MEIIKLKIDLSTMTFEFEGSAEFAREALAEFLAARPHKGGAHVNNDAVSPKTTDGQSDDDESDEAVKDGKSTGKPTKKKPTAKPESYTILPDLDLVGKAHGRQPLKELYDEKGGKTLSNYEASTVFVHYLTRVMSEKNVDLNHIYSCYKHVGLRVPGSMRQLMYDQKKRGHYINITNLNDLKLTVNGENLIDHDLPKKDKTAK